MGVVSCDQMYEEEARWEQTAREWREFWKLGMSGINDGPAEIARGRPQFLPGQQHPKDPSALVVEWWPQRIRGTNFWDLQLRYSTDVDVAGSPLSVPAAVTIDSNLRAVPALIDRDGNPIINTAGQFLTDPPSTTYVVDQVITIQKNISLILPAWVDLLPGATNADGVRIRGRPKDQGTLFCAAIKVGVENNVPGQEGQFSTLRTTPYTTAQIELWWRADGWTDIYPNVGYYQIVPVNKKLQEAPPGATAAQSKQFLKMQRNFFQQFGNYTLAPILIAGLDAPPHPWFLDANGQAIQFPTPDNIIFLEYDNHPKQPFAQLPGVGRP